MLTRQKYNGHFSAILLILFFFPIILKAQFHGGDGDGYKDNRFLGTLQGKSIQAIYLGGAGDGDNQDYIRSLLNSPNLAELFDGGDGDGFKAKQFNGSLDGFSIAGLYRGGMSDGFDQYYARSSLQGLSFPVELSEFFAHLDNGQVIIQWTTELELNHDFFTIERSQNGTIFQPLLEVPGIGRPSSYKEIDDRPLSGLSYYRLKSTDLDGSFSYSHIEEIKLESSSNWQIVAFPNPSKDGAFNLRFVGLESQKTIQIEVFNIQGQEVLFKKIINQGQDWIYQISMPLTKGSYVLKISSDGRTQQQLVMVW